RRLRRDPPLARRERSIEELVELFDDELAVEALLAFALLVEDDCAVNNPSSEERARCDASLLAFAERARAPELPPERHARRDLVDVLPALSARSGERELKLIGGDLDAVGHGRRVFRVDRQPRSAAMSRR